MNLPIIARFKSSGEPQTGLSPTVNVYRVQQNNGAFIDDVLAGDMTYVKDGFYRYNFGTFNPLYDYLFTMDAGATSDQQHLEAQWSGIQAIIDNMPKGGGGTTIVNGITEEAVKEAIKAALEQFFEGFNLDFEMPEIKVDAQALEQVTKALEKKHESLEKDLKALIGKAADKIAEVKAPITQVVDTKAMADQLAKTSANYLKRTLDLGNSQVDELLGDFAKFLNKDVKGMLETIKDSQMELARQEAREELAKEIRNNPELLTKILK